MTAERRQQRRKALGKRQLPDWYHQGRTPPGSKSNGRTSRRRSSRSSSQSAPCPLCERVCGNRGALGSHVKSAHGMSLDAAEAGR